MALSRINAQSIADGTIVAADIADGSITGPKLGATAINANNIVDGTITNAKIDTVANTKLTGTITATQMAANSVNSTILQTNSVENYLNAQGFGLGMRNRIINGAMEIDQRNAGANTVVSSNAPYTLDRWRAQISQHNGSMNVRQQSITTEGYVKSLRAIVTTANTSLPASSLTRVWQSIEGLNVADLGWGTANASPVTLSFVVQSSNTGTFSGSITNYDENRSYPFEYTIDTANTLEKKTITIPGDTSGNWSSNTEGSIALNFNLGAGSTLLGTADAWTGSWKTGVTGSFSLIGVLNATWFLTGVQIEKGSVATPFERRPYGTELALCQRYYEKSYNQSVTPGTASVGISGFATSTTSGYNFGSIKFAVTKRADPTVSTWSFNGTAGRVADGNGSDLAANSASINQAKETGFNLNNNSGGTLTFAGNNYLVNWAASAEL